MQLQTVVSDGNPLLYTVRVAHGAGGCYEGSNIYGSRVVKNVE